MSTETSRWWWCQKHSRPEPDGEVCRTLDRLGPYPTEEAARRWAETAETRNDTWETEDEEWETWPDDEGEEKS